MELRRGVELRRSAALGMGGLGGVGGSCVGLYNAYCYFVFIADGLYSVTALRKMGGKETA